MTSLPSAASNLRISKWLASLAPIPTMNGSAPLQSLHGSKHGALSAALNAALAASWRTAMLPWQLCLRWLSWGAALLIHLFSLLGASPTGYVEASKLKELNSIIEHMHTREDLYRKTIRELQDELESKDHDKKRALRRLKGTKEQLELMQQQLAELTEQYHSMGSSAAAGAADGGVSRTAAAGAAELGRASMHATMGALLLLVWWFYQQECHAIQRKLVFAVLFPLAWAYAAMLLTRRPQVAYPLLVHSTAWALIGFIGAYKFSQLT